jgi:hypothetical protein
MADVPSVKQTKTPVVLPGIAMVMQYWKHGREPAMHRLKRDSTIHLPDQAHGIFASEMEHYLKQHGYRTFAFRGRMDDIKDHLEKGRPLIVALKPSAGGAMLHYVVVVGLDPDAGLVLKNDPAERKLLKQTQSDFEREWKGAGNWTLLAVPLENGPASSRPSSSQ